MGGTEESPYDKLTKDNCTAMTGVSAATCASLMDAVDDRVKSNQTKVIAISIAVGVMAVIGVGVLTYLVARK